MLIRQNFLFIARKSMVVLLCILCFASISLAQEGWETKAPTTDEFHTLDYKYVIENNILKLSWSLPSGTEFIAEFTKQ